VETRYAFFVNGKICLLNFFIGLHRFQFEVDYFEKVINNVPIILCTDHPPFFMYLCVGTLASPERVINFFLRKLHKNSPPHELGSFVHSHFALFALFLPYKQENMALYICVMGLRSKLFELDTIQFNLKAKQKGQNISPNTLQLA